ncbi:unnamed protein product [Brassicogethes aeneus]|uniref:Tetraspanin n=1 Tax=Brassicogethes aeneus TaxID=1431903 RepID=A0A9P0B4Q8_BRAAE|nr:unnamed protein product [Brassicogethes aeneus]
MPYTADLNVSMKCVKYMLFVANFMFVMIGFLLISIGTTIQMIYGDFEVFMENRYFSPAALCVAIGIIIFFIALLGCVGALKESTCLVNTYAFCLFIILILELSSAIATYSMRNNLTNTLKINMEYSIDKYNASNNDEYAWNYMQRNLRCCGINNSDDWVNKNISIPHTCYNCETCNTDPSFLIKGGCLDKLTYIVSECAMLLGVGTLCVSFIQILGIFFANLLAKSIRAIKTEMLVVREENRQRIYKHWAENNPPKVDLPVPASSEA